MKTDIKYYVHIMTFVQIDVSLPHDICPYKIWFMYLICNAMYKLLTAIVNTATLNEFTGPDSKIIK